MKKFKAILGISILSLSAYVGIEAYRYIMMTETERVMLDNIEALATEESYPLDNCVMGIASNDGVLILPCNPSTTNDVIYNCPRKPIYADWNTTKRCVIN